MTRRDEVIEAVARAICVAERFDPDQDPNWAGENVRTDMAWPPEARFWWTRKRVAEAAIHATLDAIAEPSDDMIDAGVTAREQKKSELGADVVMAEHPAGTIYQAMIAQLRREVK